MAVATREIALLRAGNGREDEYMTEELLTSANTQPVPVSAEAVPPVTTQHSALGTQPLKYGWRAWWRLLQVSRVLGFLALYLYLDGYEVRAAYTRKSLAKRKEAADSAHPREQLRIWWQTFLWSWQDRLTRLVRWQVFRGAEGTANKDARLEKQAAWLRTNLITLGPTFIKIGQSLGTRADLLPLPYVKELSTLQDQVPAFSNAEAMARMSFVRETI